MIEATIKCAESQEIEVPFENYATFFNHLTQDCEPGSTAYINWVCTPSKKKFCDHIFKLWQTLSSKIIDAFNKNILIPFTTFQLVEFTSKKGSTSQHLKPVEKMSFL